MTPAPPALSVAICTFNRFDTLPLALAAIERQTIDPARLEVLVVDNSSDRDAAARYRRAARFAPNVRWIDSSPPGLSRARNVALEQALGEIVAFVDDDALAEPGWAEAIVAALAADPGAAVAGGPIVPEWGPAGPPDWLPVANIRLLTILDLGRRSRPLKPGEYVYGANFAIRRSLAIEAGGFDTNLGRVESLLLSGEETRLQAQLAAAGHRCLYVADAPVRHLIAPERLSRDWFRARMAWQGVSEAASGDPPEPWCFDALNEAAEALGVRGLVSTLFAPASGSTLDAQLTVLRQLTRLSLQGHSTGLEAKLWRTPDPPPVADQQPLSEPDRPSAAISPAARALFAEFRNGHPYLAEHYADLPGTQMVTLPGAAWSDQTEGLAYLLRSLGGAPPAVVLTTLDCFIDSDDAFAGVLQLASRTSVAAILHRLPRKPKPMERLRHAAGRLRRIIVLSDEFRAEVAALVGDAMVTTVPHHPPSHMYFAHDMSARRRALGVQPHQIVLGVIGEARRGKGIELLLDSLPHIPASYRDRIFLLVAGGSKTTEGAEVAARMRASGVAGHIDLRTLADPTQYAALANIEYADYVALSDIGVLLYQEEQRKVASGVLYDFVWRKALVLATADSLVGTAVRENDLGLTIDQETAAGVSRAICAAVDLYAAGTQRSERYASFRERHAPGAALAAMHEILASLY